MEASRLYQMWERFLKPPRGRGEANSGNADGVSLERLEAANGLLQKLKAIGDEQGIAQETLSKFYPGLLVGL